MAKAKTDTVETAGATEPTEAPTMVSIVPVDGLFVNGVPHVAQTLPADEAQALVATGAFVEGEAPADTAGTDASPVSDDAAADTDQPSGADAPASDSTD